MIEKFRNALIGLSVIVILAGLIMMVTGIDPSPSDQNKRLALTDFSTLDHTAAKGPNGFLMCDAELCPQARPNAPAPTFNANSRTVRSALAAIADNTTWIRVLNLDLMNNQIEFQERLPSQHLPSVTSFRLIDQDGGGTKILVYSYKPVGDAKEGDMAKQAERWLEMLESKIGG